MKIKTFAIVAFAALSMGLASAASADGAALYTSKACASCHGADAKTSILPVYPKLAGQNAEYLLEQLKDIRDGKRTNGQAAVMKPIVASLTDDEAKELADYLAGLK
ncbi:cytochrome c [Candidatus Thiothrix sp. Deng01]|uniref:Cytochrome c n=1 Tax=Candidatus Thiothrix phosphatis TaxID=3112415 RepID=A0ABU6CXS8_9GAMM|nr:cytochrome c [Candidatus Thiothrix sp. Deng01]MEB4591626.1 cytochrome c [Candidatus Thiothrix sp. Deng01]